MPQKEDFVKMWQGRGWVLHLAALKPFSRVVLAYLVDVVKFGNKIPGPRPAARELGRDVGQVGRAFADLSGQGFVLHQPDGLFLNPFYAWKGTDAAYAKVTQHLNTRRLPKAKPVIPEKRKAVTYVNRMLKEQQAGYYVDRGNNG